MSFSSANEKYRKYENLLYKDPTNALYKRKLQKYKLVASHSYNHTGGNSYIQGYKNENKTRDLIGKIQNLLSRVQQNPSDMNGGYRKNNSTNSHKASQVKGYRTMRGGTDVTDETIADQKNVATDILKRVQGFVKDNNELKEKLRVSEAALVAKQLAYTALVGERDKLIADVARLKDELEKLKLANTAGTTDFKIEIDRLKEESLKQLGELTKEIADLSAQIGSLKTNIAQIQAENVKLREDILKAESEKNDANNKLTELTKNYDESQRLLKESFELTGSTLTDILKALTL